MRSLILHTATRLLLPMLLLFSFFLLLRGHNEPGGGFVGGLVAATGFTLHLIATSAAETRHMLRVDPKRIIGIGLALAVCSGVWNVFRGQPLLTASWSHLTVPVLGKLGTPVLFDLGVYLVVLGAVLTIILSLVED